MKTHGLAVLLLKGVTLLVLVIGGCQKEHDDFFSSGPTTATATSDPLPANLIGTWTSQSAVVEGQPWELRWVFGDRYNPDAGAIRLRFTSDGEFSYELLDTSNAVIWQLQGTTALHGERLTCSVTSNSNYPYSTGFNIIDDTMSLNEKQLVLPYEIDKEGADYVALVSYTKQ